MQTVRHFKPALILGIVFILMNGAFLFTAQGQDTPPPHWTYEGEEGPSHWGELDANYELCSTGRAQSPINVTGGLTGNLVDIGFNYVSSALNIFNNGHTVQVNYDAGSSIVYNEDTYQLAQFHFHHPSEHTINGEHYAMELHFVHKDAAGNLAVVGVLLNQTEQDNPAFDEIFNNLPAAKGDPQPTDMMVDAASLLPATHTYFTYSGSLTTPPCSQGVRWLLLTTPVAVSVHQVEEFATLFEMNARPVQALNNRDLLQDGGTSVAGS
ncbi:MAG: carbonic anhydrase family protein [Anaerolineae bacterium]